MLFALALLSGPAVAGEAVGTLRICRAPSITGLLTGREIDSPPEVRFVAFTAWDAQGVPISTREHPALEVILTEHAIIAANEACTIARARLLDNVAHLGLRVTDNRKFRESGLSREGELARVRAAGIFGNKGPATTPRPKPEVLTEEPDPAAVAAARAARARAQDDATASDLAASGNADLVATAIEDFR